MNLRLTVFSNLKQIFVWALCLVTIFQFSLFAQSTWVRSISGSGDQEVKRIQVDNTGNIYAMGTFSNTVDFGGTSLTAADDLELFLAKYNSDNQLLWAVQAIADNQIPIDFAVDNFGNILLSGSFISQIKFGDLPSLGGSNSWNKYLAKYNANGEAIWAKSVSSTESIHGNAIALGNNGSFYVAGNFYGTATFGVGEPGQTERTSNGESDIYLAKYTDGPNGPSFNWVHQIGDELVDRVNAITTLGSNIYLTGDFAGSMDFGNNIGITSNGGFLDIFVAQYSDNGNPGNAIWARNAGAPTGSHEGGQSITVDNNGNSYVTGMYDGNSTGAIFQPGLQPLTGQGREMFVASYDPQGNLRWATDAGGAGIDEGFGIAYSNGNELYVTGRFQTPATFGEGEAFQTQISAGYGGEDLFIAKYDANTGQLHPDGRAKHAGSANGDLGRSVAVDDDRNRVYFAGYYAGTAFFGDPPNLITVAHGGDKDGFIASYSQSTLTVPIKANDQNIAENFSLFQNYPNPFNPETTIKFEIPVGISVDVVTLTIYNSLGQKVRTLVNEYKPAGVYEVRWDGRDILGYQAASGIYLYNLTAGQFSETKRMILLR